MANGNNRDPYRRETVNPAWNGMRGPASRPERGYIPQDNRRQVPPGNYRGQVSRQTPAGYGYVPDPRQQYNQGMGAGNRTPRPPKKQKKGSTVVIAAVLIILLAVIGAGLLQSVSHRNSEQQSRDTILAKIEPYNEKFCPGVYVDGIDLGGMTADEAREAVNSRIRQVYGTWKVQLTWNGTVYGEIDADMLGFSVDTESVLYEAAQLGHTGDAETRYEEMLRLEKEPYQAYTAKPDGNLRVIDEKLAQIKVQIDKPAVDARAVSFNPRNPDNPFTFEEEQYGWSLDTEEVRKEIWRRASALESGTVELTPKKITPSVLLENVKKNYTRRGEAVTDIRYDEDRNKNIELAFEYINSNGSILKPGETFSFNDVVGRRTQERGFYPAIEYVYGEKETGFGGGVCQASTTLYQAAVRSGLTIVERKQHSERVNYTQPGKDATVYLSEYRGGKKIDLKLRNDTDGPVYICTEVTRKPGSKNKKQMIARVVIYGKDPGGVTWDIVTEEQEILCVATPVPVMDKQEAAPAENGCIVDSYRVEYTNGVETNRVKLGRDEYKPKPARVYEP